eukprot:TRINITY_DN8366_c0_g4_i3.p1 TRINITY_DN8366_c0_g4~~TRINITY_DN8366_c0_g4_i3.p1  ORF type:complete len:231 (-),score=61.63 TRINITY_DN8366_c0_g4_i3:5-697(-)
MQSWKKQNKNLEAQGNQAANAVTEVKMKPQRGKMGLKDNQDFLDSSYLASIITSVRQRTGDEDGGDDDETDSKKGKSWSSYGMDVSDDDNDEFIEFDDQGKMIVTGEKHVSRFEKAQHLAGGGDVEEADDADSDGEEIHDWKRRRGDGGRRVKIRRDDNQKKGNTGRKKVQRSDGQKSGQAHQPYAYIRMDPSMLNKRKRTKAVGKWKGVAGAARKGAFKGAQSRKRKRK